MAIGMNRQQTAPMRTPRTRRNHPISVMTSFQPGQCVPVWASEMLREEQMRGAISINVEMQETRELLANKVMMRATAYVVPWLAFERFEGSRDQFDRSYMNEPQVEGGDVVPFIENQPFGTPANNTVHRALGLHAKSTDQINTMYLEAYNIIANFRRKNRSRDISQRTRLDQTLAEAFWLDGRFAHVVPDFDQAVIDGEVALSMVAGGKVPVMGLGLENKSGTVFASDTFTTVAQSDGSVGPMTGYKTKTVPAAAGEAALVVKQGGNLNGMPDIYAELQDAGITVSLANIAMARKAQWFAKIREKFEGYDDEYIIDMLMSGLSIPDQHLKQPILIADQTVTFGQVKRYATDASNLTVSAVSGGASVSFDLNVPKLATGGVVMVIVEVMPQQLFERQQDPFFHLKTSNHRAQLPDYLRDELDPEKVDVVLNKQIDTDHGVPDGVFGFWPLNAKWTSFGPRIGGKFYRPAADLATDTVRQRFWAYENKDSVLAEDFYLVQGLHNKPFLDNTSHPFELAAQGGLVMTGDTVFGGLLVEATNNYEEVMSKAPVERIEKE